jgi:hypothetical protein
MDCTQITTQHNALPFALHMQGCTEIIRLKRLHAVSCVPDPLMPRVFKCRRGQIAAFKVGAHSQKLLEEAQLHSNHRCDHSVN